MASASNIGWNGRRRRYLLGAGALAFGVALAAGLVLGGAPVGARLLVVVPFAAGTLGIFQAHAHT
jgi:hypothetical protein